MRENGFIFLSTEVGQFPLYAIHWERSSGNGKRKPVCAGDTPLPDGDYHLDVRCSQFIMPSCSYPYFVHGAARLSGPVFRNGAIRAYAVGFALCLLLSGCLFGSGNKQDTLAHDR